MGEVGLEVDTVSFSLSGMGEGSLLGGRGLLLAFAFRVALLSFYVVALGCVASTCFLSSHLTLCFYQYLPFPVWSKPPCIRAVD